MADDERFEKPAGLSGRQPPGQFTVPKYSRLPQKRYMPSRQDKDCLQADGSDIFVAELAGRLVGLAEVYVREDEPNPLRISRRYGHLQSLMVREQVRRQGIGKLLLQSVHAWAKARGCAEIRAETWEFGAGPLPFYERQRYRTLRRTLVFEL